MILVLTGYLAWLSFAHAVANITWQQNPDLALEFVPDHPLALSRKADELFLTKQDPASLAKVEELAKRSLQGGALNPVAIRLLASVADVRGDIDKARRLMLLSHKVSRRDLGTQLWLIEDAVRRNDKKRALYHYDIAMRTSPASHAILFPTLTGALADPEVRAGLVPIIRQAPNWLPAFLGQAIAASEDPTNLVDILVKTGDLPDQPDYLALSNQLLLRLIATGDMAAFRQYYLSLPGSSARSLTAVTPGVTTVNLRYPAAGWVLTDNPAIGGGFSAAAKNGSQSLNAFAGTGERGELMRKILFLSPGQYQFSANYQAEQAVSDAEIRWDLSCIQKGPPRAQWTVTDKVLKGRRASAESLVIPGDCPYQILSLQLAGGNGQTGMEFTLNSVSLNPIT